MGEDTEEVKYATIADVLQLAEIVLMQQKLIDSMQRQIDIMNGQRFAPPIGAGMNSSPKTPEGQLFDKTDEYNKQRDIERKGQRAAEFYRKRNEGII